MRLPHDDKERIIELKDRCWKGEEIVPEKVDVLHKAVRDYRLLGYNVNVYDMVVELLRERLSGENNSEEGK